MASELPLSAIASYPAYTNYNDNDNGSIASEKEVEKETETCIVSFVDSDTSSSDCDVQEEAPKDVILQEEHVFPQVELVSPQLDPQVESDFPRSDKHTVTFHDVSYEVSQWKYCRRQPNKMILHSVR